MDQTLAVQSKLADQFIVDVVFKGTKVNAVDPLGVPEL